MFRMASAFFLSRAVAGVTVLFCLCQQSSLALSPKPGALVKDSRDEKNQRRSSSAEVTTLVRQTRSLLTPAVGQDITTQILSETDRMLEEVRQRLLSQENSQFRRVLVRLGSRIYFVNRFTPQSQLGVLARPWDLTHAIRWRYGPEGYLSGSTSIQVAPGQIISLKRSGDATQTSFSILLMDSDQENHWFQYGNYLKSALAEMVAALRLQEIALEVLEKPLAIATPYQIFQMKQIPYRGKPMALSKYFAQYAKTFGEEETRHLMQQLLKRLPDPPSQVEMNSWSFTHTLKIFLSRIPLVQLRSWMPTDIRQGVFQGRENLVVAGDIDQYFADLFAAYGEEYVAPTDQEKNPFFSSQLDEHRLAAYRKNSEKVARILDKAAENLARTVGIIIGIGGQSFASLHPDNLVGFSFANDFDDAEIPSRDQREFKPEAVEKGIELEIQHSKEALYSLAEFLTGNPAPPRAAIQKFHKRLTWVFQQVQQKVIDKPNPKIFHPDYVRQYKSWRDGAGRSLLKTYLNLIPTHQPIEDEL